MREEDFVETGRSPASMAGIVTLKSGLAKVFGFLSVLCLLAGI